MIRLLALIDKGRAYNKMCYTKSEKSWLNADQTFRDLKPSRLEYIVRHWENFIKAVDAATKKEN